MSYPINDIFEGVSDLLQSHSNLCTHTLSDDREEIYIVYGSYIYLVVYIKGELSSITRREKEANNGQD